MSNDSAFKRLLLDTVATVILQPPSTSSLIELLRITTPTLLSSNEEQYKESSTIVHNILKREKLYRTLQLRIHPDKHSDTRATKLFQDVAEYYEKCCEEMEREDMRQKYTSQQSSFTNNNNHDATTNTTTEDPHEQQHTSTHPAGVNKSRQYQHPSRFNNPQRPNGSSTNNTHSDYERHTDQREQPNYDRFPWRRRMKRKENNNSNNSRQPPNHLCISIVSTILFPPLGVCALMHSLKVNKAYNESRYQDAKNSSDKAYSAACLGILCFIVIFLSLWLRDGDGKDFDWERIKHEFPWNNG